MSLAGGTVAPSPAAFLRFGIETKANKSKSKAHNWGADDASPPGACNFGVAGGSEIGVGDPASSGGGVGASRAEALELGVSHLDAPQELPSVTRYTE